MAYNSSNYNDHHSQPSYGSDAHYGIPNRTGSQPAEAGLPSYRDYDDSYAGGGAENHQRHLSYDDGRGGPPPAPPIKDHSAFLNKDPYGTIAQHASRAASSSYHDLDANLPGGSRVSPALMRSDTIKPTDSISQYAPNSDPSDVTTDRPASRIVRHQAQESYSSTHYGGGGYDEYPHRGSMGYAEDEEDEAKQLAKQPILFSNQLKSAEADYYTYGDAPTHAGGLSGAKQAYPFSGYAGAAEPAYGAAVGPYGFPKGSLQESIEKRRRGVRRQKYPILTYIFAVAYLIVFIIELVRSGQLTGSAIQTHPSFNPMIGPSFEFLINFGARYTPCMRKVPEFDASQVKLPCLQYANADTGGRYTENQLCTAAEICGLTDPTNPNQMWRLVVPIVSGQAKDDYRTSSLNPGFYFFSFSNDTVPPRWRGAHSFQSAGPDLLGGRNRKAPWISSLHLHLHGRRRGLQLARRQLWLDQSPIRRCVGRHLHLYRRGDYRSDLQLEIREFKYPGGGESA